MASEKTNPAMIAAYEAARLLENALKGKRLTGGFVGFVCAVSSFDVKSLDQLSDRFLAPLIANARNVLTEGNQIPPTALPTTLDVGWPTAKDEPKTTAHQAAIARPGDLSFVVRVRVWPDVKHDGYELRVDVAALAVAA